MRHVLFSFLGTGDYQSCIYYWNEEPLQETRYIQTALYQHLSQMHESLEVVIFVTPKAYHESWLNKEDGKVGLQETFRQLAPDASIKVVEIQDPDGEAANWHLFDVILNEIQQGDQIYFDMTHSFRAIPVVSLLVMNYARLIKDASLQRLVYGQFIDGQGKILDMTPMLSLFDWTNGVDQFARTGDSSKIGDIVKHITKETFKSSSQEEQRSLMPLKEVVEKLEDVTLAIQTARSQQITEEIQKLRFKIHEAQNSQSTYIKPLIPLLAEIEKKYEIFTEDSLLNGLEAAKWLANHNLIQLGYTLLQENFITAVCDVFNYDVNNKEKRNSINSAIKIIERSLPEREWRIAESEKENLKEIISFFTPYKQQLKVYAKITDSRNDINHAGAREHAQNAKSLQRKFKEAVREMEPLFQMLANKKKGGH